MKMDMKSIMKQAEDLQAQMSKKQQELAEKSYEASAGGGMVTATVNGRHEIMKLSIDPAIAKSGDVQMIEDMVIAAVNEALKRSTEAAQAELSGMMGGLGNLQGIFG